MFSFINNTIICHAFTLMNCDGKKNIKTMFQAMKKILNWLIKRLTLVIYACTSRCHQRNMSILEKYFCIRPYHQLENNNIKMMDSVYILASSYYHDIMPTNLAVVQYYRPSKCKTKPFKLIGYLYWID
ncbi:unnamed protein product [Cunninghamella echinulata]